LDSNHLAAANCPMLQLIVGTRIHTNCGSTFPDINQFSYWCKLALEYADCLLIATDDHLFQLLSQMCAPFDKVYLLQVSPWTSVVTALNSILAQAIRLKGQSLLLQSFEVHVSTNSVEVMRHHLGVDTVVVGARLNPDHGGSPGIKPIDGLTSPWNTLALWDLKKLSLTGFLEASCELLNGIHGGMEEVSTISLLQHLFPFQSKAKVVALPDIEWKVFWNDEHRLRYHHQKMITKRARAEMQLAHFPVPRGVVNVF
jgi:hypothetical protein